MALLDLTWGGPELLNLGGLGRQHYLARSPLRDTGKQ